MMQAEKEYKKRPKREQSKDVKLPVWFNKDPKASEEAISEEEKKELEELLKEFR
jgi:replication initiation and membrane attachment protein DnaB